MSRLVAIAGPLKGQEFVLAEGTLSIGRAASNWLAIADSLVSQQHCTIVSDGDGHSIRDVGSLNGLFVNGLRVTESELRMGDRIKVGGNHFVLLGDEDQAQDRVELEDLDFSGQETLRVQYGDTRYHRTDRSPGELAPLSRVASDLDTMLRISNSINAVQDPVALQQVLLELIFEAVPADSGSVLLVGDHDDEFISGVHKIKEGSMGSMPRFSRTLVRQVLDEGVAVLSNDPQAGGKIEATESLIASRVTSVLSVPLTVFGKTLGVIYLAGSNPEVRFDEDHLHLLTGIAGLATVALEHARYVDWLEGENRRLTEEVHLDHGMIGDGAEMQKVYQFIGKVGPTDATVAIRGESGTGKELVARALHSGSNRSDKPFVTINCGALAEGVVESELFGHESGAFTDARKLAKGKIEVADGGTLFLDEIGELSPRIQTRLLRVLQEREFERVGGTRPIRVDVRIITATNRDLEEAIKAGTFREDLFFRINVVSLTMPPLRERPEDIPVLADHFVRKHGARSGRVVHLSEPAQRRLASYAWPGNVRELENAIERAVVMSSDDLIRPEDLPEAVIERGSPASEAGGYHDEIVRLKKKLILDAVAAANRRVTDAAKALDLHYLHRLISNLNLRSKIGNT